MSNFLPASLVASPEQLAGVRARPFLQLRGAYPGERAQGVQCVQVPASVCTPATFGDR
jgi:hypothetical protein